jgi:hypothetical protein
MLEEFARREIQVKQGGGIPVKGALEEATPCDATRTCAFPP